MDLFLRRVRGSVGGSEGVGAGAVVDAAGAAPVVPAAGVDVDAPVEAGGTAVANVEN